MVNPTSYSMVSTLAGLRRLEAQIQRALLDAGGQAPQPAQKAEPKQVQVEAQTQKKRAESVLSDLDLFD